MGSKHPLYFVVLTLTLIFTLLIVPQTPATAQEESRDRSIEVVPQLSGSSLTYDTKHFRIHYTLSGDDAIPSEDTNGNGTPDYLEKVIEVLEYAWDFHIIKYGWVAPPSDNGFGGNDLYDVYLANIYWDGLAGYVNSIPDSEVGDNPNSPDVIEESATPSFMVLDNDYEEQKDYNESEPIFGFRVKATPLDILRTTAAHEFNHSVQFGYDGGEPANWLWEATATWMQEAMFDHINYGYEMLTAVFKSPDTCQVGEGGTERIEDEFHWYGMWIFIQYVSDQYGNDMIRRIWEMARDKDSYDALEAAFNEVGTTFDEVYSGFSVALLTRNFEEGIAFPTVRLEAEIEPGANYVLENGIGQIGSDYLKLNGTGVNTFYLSQGFEGILVGMRNDKASIYPFEKNILEADLSPYDAVYIIINNLNRPILGDSCKYVPYALNVVPGGTNVIAPTEVIVAENYDTPQIEELLDPDEYYIDVEYVDAPQELVPDYIPDGYSFYASYYIDKSDYPVIEYIDWYIPGDGPALVIDYSGTDPDFFNITVSPSPFGSLNVFLDVMDYEPLSDEIQKIGGVTVLVQDLSYDDQIYTDITYINGTDFIVFSGTLPTDEMMTIVRSVIER